MQITRNMTGMAALLILWCMALVSCSKDTEEADPYENWESRNTVYLDSIVNVCNANLSSKEWEVGKWKKVLSYKLLKDVEDLITPRSSTDYIYMKMLEYDEDNAVTEGTESIYSTDSVSVHYRGWLMNGTVFDQSYSGDWDGRYSPATTFAVGNVIVGWTTALLQMKAYRRAEVYIPYSLGYEASGSGSSIPGYSTLVFDIRVEKVIHPKGPDDRSLK